MKLIVNLLFFRMTFIVLLFLIRCQIVSGKLDVAFIDPVDSAARKFIRRSDGDYEEDQ